MTITDSVIIAMIATIPPTITAIASLLASLRNAESIRRLHTDINGRMGQLLETSTKAAHTAGKLEQIVEDKLVAAEVVKADKLRTETK